MFFSPAFSGSNYPSNFYICVLHGFNLVKIILDGIWRQPLKLWRRFYWCHLGKASYFQMFRSSFHPIPPSPSSGIYTTVASIKNDKEHLTWILLCRVQNVLFFPFTGKKKLKPPENQPLSVYQPLKNFACSGVYFLENPWESQLSPPGAIFLPYFIF